MEIRQYDPNGWMSPAQVAELVGVSKQTILKWIKIGRLHAVKFNQRVFMIYRRDAEALMAAYPVIGSGNYVRK